MTCTSSAAAAAAAAQEQVGGGVVGKTKPQKRVSFDSDSSDSESGEFVPSNNEEDDGKGKGKCRTPQEFVGTVYSAQDSRPIGKALVRADSSFVGEFPDHSPEPTPPLPTKCTKFNRISVPAVPKKWSQPRPKPAFKGAAASSSTSVVSAPVPPPPAPAPNGLLSSLAQMLAQLPPQMLMQAMGDAASLQQQQ
ncbi:hypothetical protein B0H14DRAFT_3532572 [Mycena olivaceomarginata]|nr:hypothetical protein B0H14DRAFT_3532572 [Mycena olivaceomarginata]